MFKSFCGLDFGTSNSTLGVWHNQTPTLIPLEDHETTIPSAIFFDEEEHQVLFGRQAISTYIDDVEGRLLRALKNILGTSLVHEKTTVNHKRTAFQDILGLFIAHLKKQAEQHTQTPLHHVVIGRPVFFSDHDPKADKQAENILKQIALTHGFTSVEFQYEPIAAALDYEQHITTEKRVLVIDLGGGTSDFSIVKVSPQNALKHDRSEDILANTGIHIGGTNFDKHLSLISAMPELGLGSKMTDVFGTKEIDIPSPIYNDLATWHKINSLYTPKTLKDIQDIKYTAYNPHQLERLYHVIEHRLGHNIAIEVEKAKIDLTSNMTTTLNLSFVEKGLTPLTFIQNFNHSIEEKTRQLQNTCAQALQQAQLTAEDIDTVFLTGGSTAIPFIRQSLLQITPQAEIFEGHRFGSVGTGLTLDAHRKFHSS